MAFAIKNDPKLMVQLLTTSMVLNTVAAKLNAYRMELISEFKRDADYLEELKAAYLSGAEADERLAEGYMHVSSEVDKMVLELSKEHDR